MKTLPAIVALCLAGSIHADVAQFYVAANGNDGWSGRLATPDPGGADGPFATLDAARDAVRALKKSGLPEGGVTVWIRGGTYRRASTFALTSLDAGTAAAPISYSAYMGEEVRVSGGIAVGGFASVTDPAVLDRLSPDARTHVLQADLKAQSITDYGKLTARGFGRPITPAQAELVVDDKPMTLARYPNRGWLKITSAPAGEKGGQFGYDGDRPAHWKDPSDVWVHGYWRWDWADSYEKVHSIDTQSKVVATEPPHGVYGYKKDQRFVFLNVLEELDEPGDYYIDRERGILYFWPPAALDKSRVELTMLETPVISLRQASYLRLSGLIVECSRGMGLDMAGGTDDEVAGCTFRNLGTSGIAVDGRNCQVRSCDIYRTEDGGVTLSGGNRKTLEPGRNSILNCDIHDYQTWDRTYRPAVQLFGVGNRVANNRIHEAPHCAILVHGNDHTIEYNDVFRVCLETSDAGAFYVGRDFSELGNVVQFNYFHALNARPDVQAVYLDDFASGTKVYGNTVVDAGCGVELGGGRDNTIENNIFVDARPAIHVDARGLGGSKNYFAPGGDQTLWNRLKAIDFDKPPYSTHYPQLADIMKDDPATPKRNTIAHNIAAGGKLLELLDGLKPEQVPVLDNWEGGDPGFASLFDRDFHLNPNHVDLKFTFKPLPLEKVGLYKDEFRQKVPGVWGPGK